MFVARVDQLQHRQTSRRQRTQQRTRSTCLIPIPAGRPRTGAACRSGTCNRTALLGPRSATRRTRPLQSMMQLRAARFRTARSRQPHDVRQSAQRERSNDGCDDHHSDARPAHGINPPTRVRARSETCSRSGRRSKPCYRASRCTDASTRSLPPRPGFDRA